MTRGACPSPRQKMARWCVLVMVGCSARSGKVERVSGGDAAGDAWAQAGALVARMTLAEKVGQLQNDAPAIPRLGIVAYDWWNEGIHGVARNGVATVFPHSIALAATFDEDLVRRVGAAIAEEARSKFARARGRERGSGQYEGLTFFAPNLNLFRDPRWGRGQETYGEDPFLIGRMGVAYVKGLQEGAPGSPSGWLRAGAVPKHLAVHSGPEVDRHHFDAQVDAHDLADTYLPQFQTVVREAHPVGIMAAYNRINGVPAVMDQRLLTGTLRGQWGFDGFVVGDCGAIGDVAFGHHVTENEVHAAAAALHAGSDLDCGHSFGRLIEAVAARLVTEAEVDRAVTRLLVVRARLGLLDLGAGASAAAAAEAADALREPIPAAHGALAREAAQKSLVLLANDGTLPLGAGVRRLAVVGPTADDVDVLLGNYHGQPAAPVTPLAGIRAAAAARGITVDYSRGVKLAGRSRAELREAVAVASRADAVVAMLGLSPRLEGEEGERESANRAGDRRDLNLPGLQANLLRALLATGRPVVVVLTGGGAIAMPEAARAPNALLMTWYSGEQGGHAIADVLFGDVSPSGRLPVTFYRSADDLPVFADYRMANRTYRYFGGTPAYPFGAGTGYASIVYRDVAAEVAPAGGVTVHATLENGGPVAADEVVLVFVTAQLRLPPDPLRSLAAMRRVSLRPGQPQTVAIELPSRAFTRVSAAGVRDFVAGPWQVTVGGAPPVTVDVPGPR
jgi:beta-glucosidase